MYISISVYACAWCDIPQTRRCGPLRQAADSASMVDVCLVRPLGLASNPSWRARGHPKELQGSLSTSAGISQLHLTVERMDPFSRVSRPLVSTEYVSDLRGKSSNYPVWATQDPHSQLSCPVMQQRLRSSQGWCMAQASCGTVETVP